MNYLIRLRALMIKLEQQLIENNLSIDKRIAELQAEQRTSL